MVAEKGAQFQICVLDNKSHTVIDAGVLKVDSEDWVEGDRCTKAWETLSEKELAV